MYFLYEHFFLILEKDLDLNQHKLPKCCFIKVCNFIPTKHFCVLVPEPFWHLICINFLSDADYEIFLRHIFIKIGTIFKYAIKASSEGAIWDEFSGQHKKVSYLMHILMEN